VIVPILAATAAATTLLLLGAAASDDGRVAGLEAVVGSAPVAPPPGARLPLHFRATSLVTGLAGAVGGWIVAGPPGLVGGGAVGAAIPIVTERRRESRTARLREEQLVDVVTAIAAALRSGRSLAQSLAVAGGEVGSPLGPIFAEAAERAALGVPLDEILEAVGADVGGQDARLVTGVLRLHRRTGGALAASLDDLGRTLRARREGARELRSLTAQARLSATILGLLPLGFFLFLSIVARNDVEAAYRTAAGAWAIGVGLVLQGAAFVWIRRILRVEEA
jgi:tight adherence protein B